MEVTRGPSSGLRRVKYAQNVVLRLNGDMFLVPDYHGVGINMKKMFSRLFANQTNRSFKKRSDLQERRRRLELEPLEDRTLLAADTITFAQPNTFTFTPPSSLFGLEKTNYLEFAKVHSGTDTFQDIVSINQSLNQVSVFPHNKNASSPGYGQVVNTMIDGLSASGCVYALADMTGDGISDLLVLVPTPQTGGVVQLVARLYAGQANGKFNTTRSEVVFSDTFSAGRGATMVIVSAQLRNITGDAYPELIVTLSNKELGSEMTRYASYYYVGRKDGFATSPTVIPNQVSGNPVAFANVLTTNGLQLVSQTTRTVETPTRAEYQTLSFNTYTVSNNSMVAAGKYEYAAANVTWTYYRNVDSDTADEIISGVEYMKEGSLAYGVRVTHVTSLASGSASITVSPSPPQVFSVDLDPRYGAIGDVNGDGFADIVVSDGTSYQILLNNKNGTFTKQVRVDTYANYVASDVGDFNGDGFEDVVVVGQAHVMFFPGNPTHPNYQTGKILFSLPSKTTSAVFGDFNGDGMRDIAIGVGVAGATLTVYTGFKHQGTPGTEVLFREERHFSGSEPTAILAGKFFGDSVRDDIAVLSGSTVTVYSLNTSLKEKTTEFSGRITTFVAGDLNRDGYEDIVVANESTGTGQGTLTIGRNKKDGTFDISTTLSLGSGAKPVALAIGDLNGDSRLDIAVLNAANSRVELLFQDVSGQFVSNPSGALSYVQLPNVNTGARYDVQLADFDLDGRLDLIVGLSSNKQIAVYQNKGRAGEFNTTPFWLTVPANVLNGTISSPTWSGKTYWSMTTGYVPGSTSNKGTPGVVVVSGNTVYRIQNTTPAESLLGTFEILVRDPGVVKTADSNQYATLSDLSKLTWMNEWGSYLIEVWGTSGSATTSITNFACDITFDARLFNVVTTNISTISAYTLTKKTVSVSGSSGTISLAGSTSQQRGNNRYTLLAQILVTPAINTSPANTKENVGVFMPGDGVPGYPQNTLCGIGFVNGTVQVGGKGVMTTRGISTMPVRPVYYDSNDDGRVNASDFLAFAKSYGKRPDASSPYAKFDYNRDGIINAADFLRFAQSYGKSRATGLKNSAYPAFSTGQSVQTVQAVVADWADERDFDESDLTYSEWDWESARTRWEPGCENEDSFVNVLQSFTGELTTNEMTNELLTSQASMNKTWTVEPLLGETAGLFSESVGQRLGQLGDFFSEPSLLNAVPLRTLAVLELCGLSKREEGQGGSGHVGAESAVLDSIFERLLVDGLRRNEDETDWLVAPTQSVSEPILGALLAEV
ncbi:MAG: FG-GAP-like repeat-containing protein [Thermoguttaceae bacterium]